MDSCWLKFKAHKGFSLVEVMVGASILLVSALAVAYLTKGSHIPNLDSLKACQDVNEEVLAAISSLGQGSFAYIYGTGTNPDYQSRHCPKGVCTAGELGLPYSTRWHPERTRLTSDTVRPTVRPHYLKLSSMTYLEALYNSDPGYCEGMEPIPGATLGTSSSAFHFFKSSTDGENLLKDRKRYGNTRMSIQLVNEKGATACTNPFHIRPQAQGYGDTSPVLDAGVVNPLGAGRVRVGFRVTVTTTYQNAGDLREPEPPSCTTTKNFFYQPESYQGQVATEWIVEPFSPSLPPLGSVTLPICGSSDPVAATARFHKVKRDSVFLCRDRSEVGTWGNKCSPTAPLGNPMLDTCGCSESDGCMNEWAKFDGEPPDSMPAPTFTTPNNQWFACDLLPARLVASGMVTSANQVQVNFEPEGNGVMDIAILNLDRDLPKRVRVDVIEVDSALNSSADVPAAVPGAEFAKLSVDYFGVHPGEKCEVCGSSPPSFYFTCDCKPCCDPETECCDGDSYPGNLNCPCTGPDCDSCNSDEECCKDDTYPENPHCDPPGCRPCLTRETGTGTWSCGLSCITDVCTSWASGPGDTCPSEAGGSCTGPDPCTEPCESSPPFSGGTCCSDGADAIRTYCAGPGGLEWWRERVVCRFPSATATEGSWTTENMPYKSNCSPGSCSPGQTPVCSDSGGCSCI